MRLPAVIENADLLDRDGLACVSRRVLPMVVLVGVSGWRSRLPGTQPGRRTL